MSDPGVQIRGLELRDAMAEDYRGNWQRMGVDVDMNFFLKLAQQDLELVDAAARDDRAAPAPSEPDPQAAAEAAAARRKSGDEQLAELGAQRLVEPREKKKDSILDVPPHERGEKMQACANRIAQILAPRGDVRRALARLDLESACEEMTCPDLAREFFEVFLHYRYFQDRDTPHNPFRGLSPRDAARALVRKLEDLADRSTGRLGPWWVR